MTSTHSVPIPVKSGHTWQLIGGLCLTATISLLSLWLAAQPIMQTYGLSVLTLAIVIGIALGNTLYPSIGKYCGAGVQFSKQRLLRLGIILYGFNLTFQDITSVGIAGMVIDTLIIASTFLLACWLNKHWLKIDQQTTILIGAGASICGAAAIMATEPVVKADASKVAIAVSTVVIFGTLAMFLYPWLYQLNLTYQWLTISQQGFGIYTGSTVHEVAQVVAAGRAIGDDASNTAVIIKMIRVMLLSPFLILLAWFLNRQSASSPQKSNALNNIPWFAVLFIVVAGFNSLHLLPKEWVKLILSVNQFFLAMAMSALGLTTHISAVKQAGLKPLLLALLLFFWLIIGGGIINQLVQSLF